MKFELPDLPYDYSALAPHISARTLEFHYDKHHRGYMSKLEGLIADSPLGAATLEEIVLESDGGVFNNAAQVWNHTFYWRSMKPNGGGAPGGALAKRIEQDLGGIEGFKKAFAASAAGHFGSGWTWLVKTSDGALDVISTKDADNPLRGGLTPLLTLDVWEHAYYLDYQNLRPKYIEAFIDHLLDWQFAEKNFAGQQSAPPA
jgi:superoxide dismutase, Fe-Mn family